MPPRPYHEKDGALEDVAARSHAANAFKRRWAWGVRMAGRFETRAAGRRRRPARRPSYPRVPSRGTLLPALVEIGKPCRVGRPLLLPLEASSRHTGSIWLCGHLSINDETQNQVSKPKYGFCKVLQY